MKKTMLFIILLVSIFTINVYASNKVVKPGETDYNTFKTQYNKGIQTTNISSSGTITLYGYSSCQTGSCTFKYANTSSDFEEVLKKAVKCTGGEKYIIYQTTGGADGYKASNSENYVGEAYWSEDFSITCTNTQANGAVEVEKPVTPPDTENGSGSDTGTGNDSNNGGNGEGFDSSTTTENESQGVGTYYVILGIVGIITYLLTIVVKKQNLFKNV